MILRGTRSEQIMDMLMSSKPRHSDQRRNDDQNDKDGDANHPPKPAVQVERDGRNEFHLGVMLAEAVVREHRQWTPEKDDLTHYGERNSQIHQRPRHPQLAENKNREDEDDVEHFGSNAEVQPVVSGHFHSPLCLNVHYHETLVIGCA